MHSTLILYGFFNKNPELRRRSKKCGRLFWIKRSQSRKSCHISSTWPKHLPQGIELTITVSPHISVWVLRWNFRNPHLLRISWEHDSGGKQALRRKSTGIGLFADILNVSFKISCPLNRVHITPSLSNDRKKTCQYHKAYSSHILLFNYIVTYFSASTTRYLCISRK